MTPSPPAILRVPPMVWLAALLSLLCLPLLFSGRETNYTWDETSYYLPAVRQIRSHWPRLDVERDSLSATAPGYHYFLATLSYLTGTNRLALRAVNFAVSLGVLVLLCRAWHADTDRRIVLGALVPLAASNFFVKSAAYVVTDNAALLVTAGSLVALLVVPARGGRRVASLLATLAVFIRQSSVWLLAPLAVRILQEPDRRRLKFTSWLLIPPAAVLGWLVYSWGGLVPSLWRAALDHPAGISPAAGAYLLAVLAILGSCYYAAARPPGWTEDLCSRWTIAGGLVGFIFAVIGPNVPDPAAGHWGGYFWDLAAHLPVIGNYSPVFLILAPAGGAVLAMLGRRLWLGAGAATATCWLVAFAGWAGTALANRQIFHRYYEPTILVLLICWLLLMHRPAAQVSPVKLLPLACLGVAQVLLTLLTAHARTFGLL